MARHTGPADDPARRAPGLPQPTGGRFNGRMPGVPTPPRTAAPPPLARALAFAAVLVAGVCGGLIGYAVVDVSCDGDCPVVAGVTGVVAAVGAAIGVAVVAVLTLRAMGEWKTTSERRRDRGI